MLVQRSDLIGNVATSGVASSEGGGIFSDIGDTGDLRIESSTLSQNWANNTAASPAAGGALYSKSGSVTVSQSVASRRAPER